MKIGVYLGYYCGANLATMMSDFEAMMPDTGNAKTVAENARLVADSHVLALWR